jgi:hypothetical protein
MTAISPFELIFIACALLVISLSVRLVYLLLRRRWRMAAVTLVWLGAMIVAYATTLIVTSLTSSPKYVPLGTEFRFDDWCFAVERSQTARSLGEGPGALHPAGEFRLITIRVSNRGRGRAQRERNVGAYLLDTSGRRLDVSASAQAELDASGRGGQPLDSLVPPGSSITRTLVFDVPADARDLGAVVFHGTGPRIIIGADQSYLHAPTITRLDPARRN